MEFKSLKNILEAALLASTTPMSIHRLSGLFEESENVGNGEIGRALESLCEDCEGRGVELVEVASGYRYQVRGDVHAWVAKLWTERPSRYSRALLETLALIAYRQPITRGEIEAVRGVSVSSSIIKTLEEREWIRVVGHRDVPGRPALFGTTREFLDYFNIKSLDELPTLSEIRDMESFDPELNLDGDAPAARAAMPDEDGEAGDADEASPDASEQDVEAHVSDEASITDETDEVVEIMETVEVIEAVDDDEAVAPAQPVDIETADETRSDADTESTDDAGVHASFPADADDDIDDASTDESTLATADEAPAATADDTPADVQNEENRA